MLGDEEGVEEAADEAAYPAGAIEMRTYHKSGAIAVLRSGP